MSQQSTRKGKEIVYSKIRGQNQSSDRREDEINLPEEEQSQQDYLRTKLRMTQTSLKSFENELQVLRIENDKLRQLNSEYVKQLNVNNSKQQKQQMAVDKFKKIEKITIQSEFFEQKHFQTQLKDFIKKLTSNFSALEKEHSKLVDHCRIMENDLKYYQERVVEAEEINENLRRTGKTSIDEVMLEVRDLKIQVDDLTNLNTRCKFDLAVKTDECERLKQELTQSYENHHDLEIQINELKLKHNRMASENQDRINEDQKLIYQLKLKSDFLEHEKRLAYQEAATVLQEKNITQISKKQMERELEILRDTTDNFLKNNQHIFNLASLPQISFK